MIRTSPTPPKAPKATAAAATHPPRRSGIPSVAEWKAAIARFQEPVTWRAVWQILNTLVPLAGLWVAMSFTIQQSVWFALPLAAIAGLLSVRIFIIFHDCGHGSFFRSRLANDITGFVAGMITFTPYYHWRWQHAMHHATSGDLGRRGTGDVWTMTVAEYLESSPRRRALYRFIRNPFILFFFGPPIQFVIRQRFSDPLAGPRERRSVWNMNVALLAMATGMVLWLGFWQYAVLQLVAIWVAGAAGLWLFYVQHQYEDAYWVKSEEWDYTEAALKGSSFYSLPRDLAVVVRQHRLPPHPPPVAAHPELQPRALPPVESDLSPRSSR